MALVREQVPAPLQSLCVSVLDSDAQSRRERELVIHSLASKLSDNPAEYRVVADRLRKRRDDLLQSLRAARADLLVAVQGEYLPIVAGGGETDPAQAARDVTTGIGRHDWLPGPVESTAPVPLTEEEAVSLLQSSQAISAQDEAELAESLPSLDTLPTDVQFSDWVIAFNDLTQADLNFRKDLWGRSTGFATSLELVYDALMALVLRLPQFEAEPWKLAVVQAGMESGPASQMWRLLCENIETVRGKGQSIAEIIFEFGPELAPDLPLEEQLQVLKEISAHLNSNGSISRLRMFVLPSWRRCIDIWKVNGRTPRIVDDFLALRELAELSIERQTLCDRWRRIMVSLRAPPLDALDIFPEDYVYQYVGLIRALLAWYEIEWRPTEAGLIAHGLHWPTLLDEAPPANTAHHIAERLRHTVTQALPDLIVAEIRRRRFTELTEQCAGVWARLNAVQSTRIV